MQDPRRGPTRCSQAPAAVGPGPSARRQDHHLTDTSLPAPARKHPDRGLTALTFITMCEPAHFVLDDEDRILDGTFTVLAKVAGSLVDDEPILSRNKLLERIHPAALDHGVQQLNDLVQEQMTKLSFLLDTSASGRNEQADGEGVAGVAGEVEVEDPAVFDFQFDSRVRGASIRVIPVAIFV